MTHARIVALPVEQIELRRICEKIFAEPSLMLRTSLNTMTSAADPLFGAEPELHLVLEHPNDRSFA